jgi:hypothetical protein
MILDTAQLIRRETPRDQEKIRYWRDHLRAQGGMPPIEVMPCGVTWNCKPRYLIVDGHHRHEAARAEGALCIAAEAVV